MRRILRSLLLACLALLVLFGAWGTWVYKVDVVDDPGPGFTRAEVMAIIARESPVYYRDGVTPLGVFFDQEHRRYVPYAELPQDWIHAIVAAEDGNFFRHPGVDPKHILRAMIQNFQAGGVVAGGSTLTQQTAKNLYYRPDRSLRSKLGELKNALRLEAHFSKEDILEFYANQFHVSANGRGFGIAARYFFDKEPAQLTTKECAFIAGMVKAPSTYNPFLGETPERRAKAQAAAERRTAYVLGRMREEGSLDERTYLRISAEPLVFKRGAFQYDRSVVVDEVQAELDQPAFVELFERLGIDNPSTAGLQIVTTLDPAAQREATYALWHHLTELGPVLESSAATALRLPDRTVMPMAPGVPLERHVVYLAKVSREGAGVSFDVGGRPCLLDAVAETRIAEVLARAATGNPRAAATSAQRAALRAALPSGAYTLVSVRDLAGAGDAAGDRCDIELRPTLQGAVVVLEDGQVRAMIGGNDNRNYNRVTTATRQLGSTWKPLVYEAAMQLGWLPTDILDNRRNVFPFRDVWYYPNPDHPNVSFLPMALVGARSENLASVWLLAHLTDRLNTEQLRRLIELVGLARRPDETPTAWMERLRDVEGIRSSPERFEEYAFALARQDVLSGLAFAAHPEDAAALRSLAHGHGVAQERARLLETVDAAERRTRLELLDANLQSLEELAARCMAGDFAVLSQAVDREEVACGAPPEGFVPIVATAGVPDALTSAWDVYAGTVAPSPELVARAGSPDRADLVQALLGARPVAGRIHLSTLRELRSATNRREAELAGRDPWDPDVLALNPDLRVLVGIRYLQKLVAAYGVPAELPTTLTLPLGAADVRLLDAALLYQGLLHGQRYRFEARGFEGGAVEGFRSTFPLPTSEAPVSLIAEIRDDAGSVLYRATPVAVPVADERSGALVGGILRDVVRVGTGRRASGAVTLGGQPLPLAGKTGTTNDYRNAAFVGFAPRTTPEGAAWGSAFTIAAYVGYDDNRSMKRGSLRVQGASGALPAWIGTVRGLAEAGLLGPGGVAEYTAPPGIEEVQIPGAEGDSATVWRSAGGTRRYAPFTEAPVELPGEALEAAPAAEDSVDEPPTPPEGEAPSVWDEL